jgi:hypothetical protein
VLLDRIDSLELIALFMQAAKRNKVNILREKKQRVRKLTSAMILMSPTEKLFDAAVRKEDAQADGTTQRSKVILVLKFIGLGMALLLPP